MDKTAHDEETYDLHCDNMATNPDYRIAQWIEYLYDYGVDIDDNGSPDIVMQTISELQIIRDILRKMSQ